MGRRDAFQTMAALQWADVLEGEGSELVTYIPPANDPEVPAEVPDIGAIVDLDSEQDSQQDESYRKEQRGRIVISLDDVSAPSDLGKITVNAIERTFGITGVEYDKQTNTATLQVLWRQAVEHTRGRFRVRQ